MLEENQLRIITRILENYKMDQPLSRYLKQFYKVHHQMGSRDRKLASAFVYNYFRIGKSLNDVRTVERLSIANFLCSFVNIPLLNYCLEKYTLISSDHVNDSVSDKIQLIKKNYTQFNPERIFPFADHLSERIDKKKLIESFLIQPKLWIRIRKEFREKVYSEFTEQKINFEADETNPLSLALNNATSLEKTNSFINGYFEIQDWSSQQTGFFIQPQDGEYWWDTCCGSGGKSLMLLDIEPTLTIFATDRRESILKNFEERILKTGQRNIETKNLDLSLETSFSEINPVLNETSFKILADVPCSGSGTWGRTPEWLQMFNETTISAFVKTQRRLVSNLSRYLGKGGTLIYITCSVFKEENEGNAEWFEANTNLILQRANYIEGWNKGADSMFIAKFIKE
jgi:16S rRNA (cytosine967-C5)-methyltransferase